MVRVATRDDRVVADFSARLPGRGGYLHPRRECLERFMKAKVKVFRSLKRAIDPAERRAIVEKIERARSEKPAAGIVTACSTKLDG